MPSFAQVATDTTQTSASAYDSIWTNPNGPAQAANSLDSFMLAHDKLYTVLIVVLLIWFGILFFLFRTDRKLARLERTLDERIPRA